MKEVRLSKLMSERGLCSRREADRFIEQGWVYVDGERITTLGTKVRPDQIVTLDERAQRRQKDVVTILLNKPIGYVSGQPEKDYAPAIDLVTAKNHYAEDRSQRRFAAKQRKGLAPAGRLDIDSQGLLVLTQDGRIAKQLIGADSRIEKEYLVRVGGDVTAKALRMLNHGLTLDGRALRPAKVTRLNEDQLRFILTEGRKRQIRRMCELVGLAVTGLKRVRIGHVKLGRLPRGQWRYLGERETF